MWTKKCLKPSGQAFSPPPPNGQCPYGGNTFQKGTSLNPMQILFIFNCMAVKKSKQCFFLPMFCLVFQFLQSVPKLTLANWSLGDYLMLPFSNLAHHCPASSVWFCPPGECKHIIGYTSMRTLLGSCNCQSSSIFRLLKREKPENKKERESIARSHWKQQERNKFAKMLFCSRTR